MRQKLYLLGSLLFVFSACFLNPKKEMLLGQWRGAAWRLKGQDLGRDATQVSFIFRDDKTYQASMGAQGESGTYWLDGVKLYTTAEDKVQKVVKITRLTADTLIFDMNRMGQPEELVLVKVK